MSTTTPSSEKDVPAVPLQIDLRDYFAGQALVGLLASGRPFKVAAHGLPPRELPYDKAAYAIADGMLAERTKDPA